jgi:phosphocarrier protein HPr
MAKKISSQQRKSLKEVKQNAEKKSIKKFKIKNELGLHARAAASFVKITSRFNSEVDVEKKGQKVNGKSIMGILMLAASRGSTITIDIHGDDCDDAMAELEKLIRNNFNEK